MNQNASFRIAHASTPKDIEEARRLFLEYSQALNVELCFQTFEKELASLPGDYGPPMGRLLLASDGSRFAGCVGLRPLSPFCGEMKRLYVRPEFRGRHLGRQLTETLLRESKIIGYKSVELDTLPELMPQAVALYESLGFRRIPAPRPHPIKDVLFMGIRIGA